MFIAKLWQTSAVLVLSTLAVGCAGVISARSGFLTETAGYRSSVDDEVPLPIQKPNQKGDGKSSRPEITSPKGIANDYMKAAVYQAVKKGWEACWTDYQAGRGTLDFAQGILSNIEC